MSSYDWFRLWHGTPVDAKLTMIAKQAGARRCEMTALWECLLDYASQHPVRGTVAGADLEVIAFSQEIDYELVLAMYAGLERKGVIADGKLVNWSKNQPEREDPTAAERKQRQRDRERDTVTVRDTSNNEGTSHNVTPMSHTVTQRHEMSRLDREGEGDRDQEREKDTDLGGERVDINLARTCEAEPAPTPITKSQSARLAERALSAKSLKVPQRELDEFYQQAAERAERAGVSLDELLAELDVGRETRRWQNRDAKTQRASWLNWMDTGIGFALERLEAKHNGGKRHEQRNRPESAAERRAAAGAAAYDLFFAPADGGGVADEDTPVGGPRLARSQERGRSEIVDLTARYVGRSPA